MSAGRLARTLLAASLLLGVAGCEYFVAGAAAGAVGGAIVARDIRVRPGASVRVDFPQARDVLARRVVGGTGDTLWLRDTRQLFGRVQRTAGDSVWIGVSESRGAAEPLRFPLGGAPVALVRQEPGVRIEPLANRPAYVVAGALAGTGVALLAVLVYCAVSPCLS